MKRTRWIVAVSMLSTLLLGGVSWAKGMSSGDDESNRGGFGFHNVEAPMGIRWWASPKWGLDFGFGFHSDPAAIDPSEKETGWAIEAGVPFMCHSWDKVHALIRPGFMYQSQQIGFDAQPATPGIQFDTENTTSFDVSLEGEAEVFIANNVSVSAAHGFRFRSTDPGFGADRVSSFSTTGHNFTTIGFHIYLMH